MKAGDKVVCIDATPLPNYAPRDSDLSEFSFPDGFIEEGMIYCIDETFMLFGELGLFLVGKRILCDGEEVGWLSRRFRKLEEIQQENEVHEAAGI